ncbi:alpha-L-fucosidase [Amycolatopsis sp. DSM 110486]|uniref:alpha-L-fucosidase n=1 Tax=Amycolatopsis sp. DSM 110486 TaxID=2865832 RepID=UPI001C6A3795|nr:alpha-L-fucosidase [Amycolatopsis sp. DSM 110486]QYN18314.1 alpha-L-fucosidase [Amycolatopsis sp. DSM 110486]
MPISTRRNAVLAALFSLAVAGSTATPGVAAPPDRGCTGPIKTAAIMTVQPCDGMDRVLAKAAAVVPRPGQLAWQQRPVTAFTHFGMNTFTDREWGSGAEKESTFAPPAVDTDQWMRSLKAAGVTQVMLTAKHHDGFVLYPTRYTDHSVVASPWWLGAACTDPKADAARQTAQATRSQDPSAFWQARDAGCTNPRGDILRDYVDSARKAGLKVGVYLSPADGAELPATFFADEVKRIEAKVAAGQSLSIEEQATYDDRASAPQGQGRYGTGSAVTERTIPTLVAHDDRAAALAAGKLPRFTVDEDDYNTYYLNQLYELFTQYGPIDELWLDGANPWRDRGVSENYDFTTWFSMIHALSPNTVTFAGPAGVRWVGNEAGQARTTEWSPLPTTGDPNTAHNEELFLGGATATDLGSRQVLADPSVRFLQWAPAESDVSIRPGWFFHTGEQPKTAAQLVDIYRRTVGRNSSLLLNVPPGPDGEFAPADVAALAAFGQSVAATQVNQAHAWPGDKAGAAVTDGSLTTSWTPPHGALAGTLDVPLARPATFDQIRLGEDISRGQHVEGATVQAEVNGAWQTLGTVTTIGYTRLVTLSAPVTTSHLRVVITQARDTPYLSTFALYRTVAPAA